MEYFVRIRGDKLFWSCSEMLPQKYVSDMFTTCHAFHDYSGEKSCTTDIGFSESRKNRLVSFYRTVNFEQAV
jgi:hypothetical protein